MPDSDIEQPAAFYLGREYDQASREVHERPVMYDARDLTTHGVVVGMTGSGKTGLCITLLEEAAIDGIPCIIIDLKGDLTNLLLQFPDLDPTDFKKWLSPEDVRQKKVTLDEHSRQLADQWRAGLAASGQGPERIKRLQESSEWRIYTPGSEAGLPLSILNTFTAPKTSIGREELNQKIDATTTALLGLAGIDADPVQSREHILIAQLFLHSWGKGRDLDLPRLISQIQEPPLSRIGAFDVETFYPEKERLKLAVALNNILAAPSFSTWVNGEPLDLTALLDGGAKPRQLIFYLAHLEDAQRMFFLTLLLEEVLGWTRKQPGTTNLRAILYFDEVFGYLPPHPANPPTKAPLMTLLKQARAFGVGILLATQNPVDLDYKALSNAGTWFVGKLQTERDKARLVEGLEGVAAERGSLHDKGHLETVISALGSRVFLLHDVHRAQPILFHSRWALSFLRGPMTRDQVALLMEATKAREAGKPVKPGEGDGVPSAILLCPKCQAELDPGGQACAKCGAPSPVVLLRREDREFRDNLLRAAGAPSSAIPVPVTHVPPVLAGVTQYYLTMKEPATAVTYRARLLGSAEAAFVDRKRGIDHRRPYRLLTDVPRAGEPAGWSVAVPWTGELAEAPHPGARWDDAPDTANTAKKLAALQRDFLNFLAGSATLTILTNRALGLVGTPDEELAKFQERCRAEAGRMAQEALAALRAKALPKFKEFDALPPDDAEAKSGSSWLSMLGLQPAESLSKAETRRQEKRRKLEDDYRGQRAAIVEKWRAVGEAQEEVVLKPKKADLRVTHFGLAWVAEASGVA